MMKVGKKNWPWQQLKECKILKQTKRLAKNNTQKIDMHLG